jgi:hypothetical protein
MDRYQFVEKMVAKREQLADRRGDLVSAITKAKKRSIKRFQELLTPPQKEAARVGELSISTPVNWNADITIHDLRSDLEKVSDEDIIGLGHDIRTLEEGNKKLESELRDLKANDFVSLIQGLMADSE